MEKEDLSYLIGTGLALGVVHVLTGPDHLSALATLSANVSNTVEAAYLGIRWGIGHSSGLLVVGTVLILLTKSGQATVEMPDYASRFFESIVGIFMLFLGAYGVRRAWLKRPKAYYNSVGSSSPKGKRDSDLSQSESSVDGIFKMDSLEDSEHLPPKLNLQDHNRRDTLEILFDGDDSPVCIPPPDIGHAHVHSFHDGGGGIVSMLSDGSMDCEAVVVVEQEYLQTVSPSRCRRWIDNMTRRVSAKTMAFCIGIVHGLAGPGGVLGVIPAVQLQNWKLAAIYLSCFCASSTITMGCFASMYGVCSSKIAVSGTQDREFQIECLSAVLSIIVGTTWLILLAIGKLEDVFP